MPNLKHEFKTPVNTRLIDAYQAKLYGSPMFGPRLRKARNLRALPLRAIGEAMDVTPQAVAQWEKGIHEFTKHRLVKLANLLDVDPEWLEGVKGDEENVLSANTIYSKSDEIQLIPKELAVLYASGLSFKSFPISGYETLRPTSTLTGRGFAIRATADNEMWDFRAGDIGIFDNGLGAQEGDLVVALALNNSSVQTIFVKCMAVHRTDGDKGWARHVAADETSSSYAILQACSEVNVVGVLVEHRRVLSMPDGSRRRP